MVICAWLGLCLFFVSDRKDINKFLHLHLSDIRTPCSKMAPRKTVGILGRYSTTSIMHLVLIILRRWPARPDAYPPCGPSRHPTPYPRLWLLHARQTDPPPPPSHSHPDGPFTSEPHIRKLASACDILTVEIEHVNADVLEAVEKEGLCEVQPSPKTIRLIQNKYDQRSTLPKRCGCCAF